MKRNRALRIGTANGVTLLELLVSVAILALVAGAVYGTFSRTLGSRDYAVERARAYTVARAAIDWIERDLRACSSARLYPSGDPHFVSIGSADGLTSDPKRPLLDFATVTAAGTAPLAGRARLPANAPSLTDQARIVYRLEQEEDSGALVLARYDWRPALAEEPDVTTRSVVARGVVAVEFRFFDGSDWQPDWNSRRTGRENGRAPIAVETRVTIKSTRGEPLAFVSAVMIEAAIVDG